VFGLLTVGLAGDFFEPDPHTVAVGADQRVGDVGGDRRQVVRAGEVRFVDQVA
jgi:hypothetical protein